MSRRNRPPNRFGCKPTEDVCVGHDLPLECGHGCYKAAPHKCAWLSDPNYTPAVPLNERDETTKAVPDSGTTR